MDTNPYSSPQAPGALPERKTTWRFTLVELLVVVGIITMLIGLLLPNVRVAREPARRAQCNNNLRQIALGLQNYMDAHGALPPAYTVDAEGRPLHSWRTLILPYMEMKHLYERIDLTQPWDDPVNKAAYETQVSTYSCPSAACPPMHTTYLAVVAPSGCFLPSAPRPLAEITDHHGSTLMVIEVAAKQAVHWMSPQDASQQAILARGQAGGLPHSGGAHGAFVDGRVRWLAADTSPATLGAMISIAGNDAVAE